MIFKTLDEILPGIEINLRVLSRGTGRYRMLLYQHEGTLCLSENETKLGNLTDTTAAFRSFLRLAKEKNVDLAITPEYSCPWSNIQEIIEAPDSWPADGKIWALGSESITPQQLIDFKRKFNDSDKIIYFDETRLNQNELFFDPLMYIFQGRVNGSQKLIILVQFKTLHMGVRSGGELERDRIILGQEIYIIRNNNNSINLLTLICSEAMNFPNAMNQQEKAKYNWNDHPFLVLNPQLNPDPIHPDFINFRRFMFEQERKEVISLNWNANSKIGKKELLQNGSSRSGIYLNSSDIQFENQVQINNNHKLGMYYFYASRNNHVFILNSKPHAYLLENLSVSITEGTPSQRLRNGPEVKEVYLLQDGSNLATMPTISDCHLECLEELGCENEFLNSQTNCILEKERLVCLTTGTFLSPPTTTWSSPEKLFSFRLKDNTEIIKRLTFAEDKDNESVQQRHQYIEAINVLDKEILPNKEKYPKSLADLKSFPVFLGYPQDATGKKEIQRELYRYNLVTEEGKMVNATVCYLGLTSLRNATDTYIALRKLFDRGNMNWQRIVVYYKKGLETKIISHENPASYVNVEEKDPSSFLS